MRIFNAQLNLTKNVEFIEDKDFKGLNFTEEKIKKAEYENCLFANCNFSNCDLSNIIFVECRFENCDFSISKLTNTTFRDVYFKFSKLLGLHFEDCNSFLFSAKFENCQLNFSSFYKLSLQKTLFKNCNLSEADFSETNLTNSVFDNCNLNRTIFENTILEKVNFQTSYNFLIDPEKNRIKKAKFSKDNISGLLFKYNIIIR